MTPVMNIWAKRILWALAAVVAIGAAVWAWMPAPVPIDVGEVRRDTFTVTVDEDGKTRVIDKYTISAPLTGELQRIRLDEGDRVERGEVVARITPMAPPLLDVRSRQEAQARVAAAEAEVRQTQAQAERAREAYRYAQSEAARQARLAQAGVVTRQAAEQARLEERTSRADLRSARFAVAVAQNRLELARTALRTLSGERAPEQDDAQTIAVASPVDSEVLQVIQESAGVVQMGAPLVELGNLGSLEAVVDVLTTDAVEVHAGDRVRLVRWGGQTPIDGRVTRVDPSAFTKVSSLGVEEQRVNVIISLDGPTDAVRELGDGYRVEAKIIVWQKADVLQVDASAVFRSRGGWAVYRVVEGEAQFTPVEVGRRTERSAQILDGLSAGDRVVLYPTDAIEDGVDVEARQQ